MQHLRILIIFSLALVAWGAWDADAQTNPPVASPGSLFSPMLVEALAPASTQVEPLDLRTIIGKRPVVIVYFLLGEAVGEEVFLQVQEHVEGLDKDITLFGATRLGPGHDLATAAERLSLYDVSVPVIIEEQLILGRALGVTTSPSIALIDHRGILRLANARSLKQEIASGMTLKQAIENLARRGPVPTVAKLPRYYPAYELIGEPFPDFILKEFGGTQRIRLSEQVGKEKKVTALLFWHPNCKHCKKAMPSILVGEASYAEWIDVLSVVNLEDENEVRNCKDTIRAHGIRFPVLEDEGKRITDMYKVISTPTMFFLGPDGLIDSVYTSGEANYVPVFSSRIRSILKVGKEYE